MKIPHTNSNAVNQAYASQAGTNPLQGKSQKPEQAQEKRAVDQVSLSGSSRDLKTVAQGLDADPGNRAAKVAELKAAVQNGTYTADAKKSAEKIVAWFVDGIA